MSASQTHNLQRHLSTMLFTLQAAMSAEQHNWLISALAEISKTKGDEAKAINRIVSYTAMVRRCVGEAKIEVRLPIYDEHESYVETEIKHWTIADLTRVVLIGSGLKDADDNGFDMVTQLLRFSDNNEKKSIYLGLYWLVDDERLSELLVDAQRTNAVDMFAAITLNNPAVAKYFDEAAFNQIVLKSLFQKMPIDQIIGLQKRRNDELVRMADDYLHERRLASREIPPGLWLLLSSTDLSTETTQAWQLAISSQTAEQRFYAIKALGLCLVRGEQLPQALVEALQLQANQEEHPAIQTLVQDMQSLAN